MLNMTRKEIVKEVLQVYKENTLQSANVAMSVKINEIADKQVPKLKLWVRMAIAEDVRIAILNAKCF
jgi:hypothetical protein